MASPLHSSSLRSQPAILWMPGMRLMGNLQFTGKALLISCLFALPVARPPRLLLNNHLTN